MSEVKVNKISPVSDSGTTLFGDSGDTFTVPSGANIVNNGTATGFGATAGTSTIWIPAIAMYPTTTTGCNALAQVEVAALRPELKSLDFPVAADSYAQFAIAFPKSWDRLALQYQTYWSVSGTVIGTVVFTLAAVAMSSDDPFGVNFGTAVSNTALAASGTANDLMVNAKSGDVTVGGSPAENDQVFFQIARDVSAGTQPADVRLLGVKLFFTTNAENDD